MTLIQPKVQSCGGILQIEHINWFTIVSISIYILILLCNISWTKQLNHKSYSFSRSVTGKVQFWFSTRTMIFLWINMLQIVLHKRPFSYIPQCIWFGGQYTDTCEVTQKVINVHIENVLLLLTIHSKTCTIIGIVSSFCKTIMWVASCIP